MAAQAGLVLPAPGEVRYLTTAPLADARRAAKRLAAGDLATPAVAPLIPPATSDPVAAPETWPPRRSWPPRRAGHARGRTQPAPEQPDAAPVSPQQAAAPVTPRHPPSRRVSRRAAPSTAGSGSSSPSSSCSSAWPALRATWLGTVRADSLGERAATQQVEDLDVPARRGTITDRRGVELAVSEDAITVFANPLLVEGPDRHRRQARAARGALRGRAAQGCCPERNGLRLPAAQARPRPGREGGQAGDRGHRHGHRAAADLPAGRPGRAS